jgi:beta-lactamase class A
MMKGQLEKRIRSIAARLDGVLGVYVRGPGSGDQIAVNADQPFPMASVFKVPILAELLCREHAGEGSLAERVALADEMKSPGSGVLKELSAGTVLTVRDLATLMIIVSDNTATDILLARLTKEAVNARLRACGLERTTVAMNCRELLYELVGLGGEPEGPETRRLALDRLRRQEIDAAGRVYHDERINMTTPREMGALLEHVARAAGGAGSDAGPLPPEVCRGMLAIMGRQQVRNRLPLLLPPGAELAHKTGSFNRVSNDAGILTTPHGPCVMSVFGKDLANDLKGQMAIARVGLAVYEAYA